MNFYHNDSTALRSPVKLIGLGAAGSRLAGQLAEHRLGETDVLACTADARSLHGSKAPHKFLLGHVNETAGRGHEAAVASAPQLRQVLSASTELLVLVLGLGGTTGTGAAPVLAHLARELGIPTVAVVTLPYEFEGIDINTHARYGLLALLEGCDAVLVHELDDLARLDDDLLMSEAYPMADERIIQSVLTLLEPLRSGKQEELLRFLSGAGQLFFGFGRGRGPHRAKRAVRRAVDSMVWSEAQVLTPARPEVLLRMGFSRHCAPSLKEQKALVKGLGSLGKGNDSHLFFTLDDTWREELDCSVLVKWGEGE